MPLRAHQRLEQPRQRPQAVVARRHLVRVGEEARQVLAVLRLAVAVLQAAEDAQHLQVALQAHPLELAPELAEVVGQRQAGLARRLPVAHRPVDLLLLVPGDEGVAQQRGHVVADRAAHRVLEVEDAGVGLGRPSGCAACSRGAPPPSAARARWPRAGRRPPATAPAASARPGDAELARPRTSRETAPARGAAARRRRAAGRSHRRASATAPARAMASRISASTRVVVAARHAPPAASCRYSREPRSVSSRKPCCDVLLQHPRRVQPGALQQRGHGDEGAHVFLRRRRVHHDEAARRLRRRRGSSGESSRRWRRCAASPGRRRMPRGDARRASASKAAWRAASGQAIGGSAAEWIGVKAVRAAGPRG